MNPRRTVILIVAVVIGGFAAAGLWSYVRSAESSGQEAARPVDVWVVKQPIPKGTSIDSAIEQGLIGLDQLPQEYRPATAVLEPATELAGLVAITDLPVDQLVLTGSFASPNVVNTGISDRLKDRGLVTVTIDVDQTRGVAYLLEPGDFVNVLVERDWANPWFEEDPPVEMTPEALEELAVALELNDSVRPILTDLYPVESRVVYQKVEVLAVGKSLVPDLGEQAADRTAEEEVQAQRNLITLAVPPEAVQVILNVRRGDIYLSLVPDDYEPRPMLPLDPTTQVLPGEVDGTLTPYDGRDDVVDPTAVAEQLLFGDAEDRIGQPPSSGSGSGGDETGQDPNGPDAGNSQSRNTTTTTAPPAPDDPDAGDETTTTTEATTTTEEEL